MDQWIQAIKVKRKDNKVGCHVFVRIRYRLTVIIRMMKQIKAISVMKRTIK